MLVIGRKSNAVSEELQDEELLVPEAMYCMIIITIFSPFFGGSGEK